MTVAAGLSAVLLLEGCATTPMGPTVQVMPAQNKPFDQFASEDAGCRQYAGQQVSGQADAANNQAVGTTLLTTALGAGLGAAVGGGKGAGVGAATGGVVGTALGAGNSQHTQPTIQQQYDNAYAQCMYAKGNQVIQPPAPVAVVRPTVVYTAPPPGTVYYAPPPTVVYAPPPGVVYAPPPGTVAPPPAGGGQ
jgi:uncharacterized protein YcfJ